MSNPVSAFARYSQETKTSTQNDAVLPASRKRKRVSMTNTNGHTTENQPNKNRSKSLQQPLPAIPETNGQSKTIEQPSTLKKAKNSGTKFLSPAYPTPYPQRRVIVPEPRQSQTEKELPEESDESVDDEDDDQV